METWTCKVEDLPEIPPFPVEEYKLALEAEEKLRLEIATCNKQLDAIRAEVLKEADLDDLVEEVYSTPEEFIQKLISLKSEADGFATEKAYIDVLIDLKEIDARSVESPTLDDLSVCHIKMHEVMKSIESEALLIDHKEHLMDKAAMQQARLWHTINDISLRQLRQSLKTIDWPVGKNLNSIDIQSACGEALRIYHNEELPDVLNIFGALVEPLEVRFRYHFDSKRPTNRLDKPEWFFQHITSLAEEYSPVVNQSLQSILESSLQPQRLLATHEFIRGLLPMLIKKVQSCSRQTVNDTDLLTHLIAQAKIFDDTIRGDFGFRNRDLSYWLGTAEALLRDDVFDTWLHAEDEFVKVRFHEIVDDLEAFEIPMDGEFGEHDVIPNAASLKIIDIFEAMSRQFSQVENLSQRSKFVKTIQRVLLDSFIEKIRASTDAFEQLSTGFSGGFPAVDITGLGGLQRLCRQLSGVVTIHDKLLYWSDEAFYVELDSINDTEGCFADQVKDYAHLRERIEGLIISHLERDLTQDLRPYTKLKTWEADVAPAAQFATSSQTSTQLVRVLEDIVLFMAHLTSVASPTLVHRLYRSLAVRLDLYIWTYIISRNKFSRRGALQLKRDIWEIWATFLPFVARPEQAMRRVSESLMILSDGSDAEERKVLDGVSQAKDTFTLREAGVSVLSLKEVKSLLDRKLFSVTDSDSL